MSSHNYSLTYLHQLEIYFSCLAYTEQDAACQLRSTVLLADQSQLSFTVNNIVSLIERLTEALRFVFASVFSSKY